MNACASAAHAQVAPTALHIPFAASALKSGYQVSAQDVWATPKDGAFTGCLTPGMVADFGHSRRVKDIVALAR